MHHIIISLNLCSLLAVTIIILNVAQPGGRFPLARCYPRIVSRTPYFLPSLPVPPPSSLQLGRPRRAFRSALVCSPLNPSDSFYPSLSLARPRFDTAECGVAICICGARDMRFH